MKNVRPLHVLAKAFVLYVLANAAFAYFDPPVGKLSIYNWLVPGRLRVPYEREVDYYDNAHTIPVYEDMDAMYQSTQLSQPPREDEFRVFLLGDSSAWGFELQPHETLVGQINSLALKTCDGKNIVAYNAAFPLPYVMKDLLVLDKVREYEPDMFLWLITLDAFRNRRIFTNYFLDPYGQRAAELVDKYQLSNLDTEGMSTQSFWDRTIIGQRSRLKKILLLQLYGPGWSASGLDYDYQGYVPLANDQTSDDLFFEILPGRLELDRMLFDVLQAGYVHAARPVLVVNEPIFIASGANSDIRYNEFYPRWAYDEYRAYLSAWMQVNQHEYVDAWDLVPPSDFSDTPFHLTSGGEKVFAEHLAPQIQKLTCTK